MSPPVLADARWLPNAIHSDRFVHRNPVTQAVRLFVVDGSPQPRAITLRVH